MQVADILSNKIEIWEDVLLVLMPIDIIGYNLLQPDKYGL